MSKKKSNIKRYKLIICIFVLLNLFNAITVVNFLPGICKLDSLICAVEELIIFQSPPDPEEDDTITPQVPNVNDNNFFNFFPPFISPIIPDEIIDNFTPNLSTITEETTKAAIIFIQESENSFQNFLNLEPTSGGSRTPVDPGVPPVITDCSPTQIINQNINLSCYKGRRTYNTHLLTIENTNTTQSCNLELSIDDSSGPAVISNLTTGNADIFFIVSTVENSLIDLELLPAPEKIGTWTQWYNNPLQVELIGPTAITPNTTETFVIPQNSSRNLGVVMDCGVDTIIGETATIKLRSTFKD